MNLLDFSETQDEEQRVWISMVQTGLSDNSFSKLTSCSLPPKFCDEVHKLILELNNENSQRKQKF